MNLVFSEKRLVETRKGKAYVQTAEPTKEFWDEWKEKGGELKSKGYSLSKYSGKWEVCLWSKFVEKPATSHPEAKEEAFEKPIEDLSDVILLPEIEKKLLTYQIPSAKRLLKALQSHGKALDASELGTGKTFTSLSCAKQLGLNPVVICPKAVIPSWYKAADHFGITILATNYEQIRTGKTTFGRWVEKEEHGRSVERFEWTIGSDSLVIFDEIQKLKGEKSQNSEIGLACLAQGFKVIGLSATPADNPTQMRFFGALTGLHNGMRSDFYKFMFSHGCKKTRFGMQFFGSTQTMQRINERVFPNRGTRMKRDECKEFPECQIEPMVFDCGSGIDEAYKEMFDELARIEAREDAAMSRAGAENAIRMIARQRIEMLKIPSICELATDWIEQGQNVVVFTNFRESLKAICEKLGTNCFIQGGQPEAHRQESIDRFQNDQENVIVVNTQSGGAGISLHATRQDSRQRSSIICPTWSAQDLKQATGRIWRAGGTKKAYQVIFYANNDIETKICEKVKEKIKRIDTLTDGTLEPVSLF